MGESTPRSGHLLSHTPSPIDTPTTITTPHHHLRHRYHHHRPLFNTPSPTDSLLPNLSSSPTSHLTSSQPQSPSPTITSYTFLPPPRRVPAFPFSHQLQQKYNQYHCSRVAKVTQDCLFLPCISYSQTKIETLPSQHPLFFFFSFLFSIHNLMVGRSRF